MSQYAAELTEADTLGIQQEDALTEDETDDNETESGEKKEDVENEKKKGKK
jgi:hypothetical protein